MSLGQTSDFSLTLTHEDIHALAGLRELTEVIHRVADLHTTCQETLTRTVPSLGTGSWGGCSSGSNHPFEEDVGEEP